MEDPRMNRIAIILTITGILVGTSVLAILLENPVADAGDDQVVDVGEMVQFDGSRSQHAASYLWNFRDNGWSNATANPTRVYHIEGVYDVGLVAIASNGQQSLDTVRITVRNNPPIADAGQNVTAYEDEAIIFDGSGTTDSVVDAPDLTYRWDFRDGYNASGMIVEHNYSNAGIYSALLSVRDDQGAIGRAIKTITVMNKAPTVTIPDVVADEGTAFVVSAKGQDTPSDEESLRYEWDNGKCGENANYVFNETGVYHPLVVVRDNNNATASRTGKVDVRNIPPVTGILSATSKANITLRATGEKWHDLQLFIYSEGTQIGNMSIFRVPGNPDAQEVTLSDFTFDLSIASQIKIHFTPEDDPVNGQPQGDTPAWVIFTFEDGSFEIVNHNFNVAQQDSWIWTVNPTAYLSSHEITFEGYAFDPGFDTLTTEWDFGDGTIITDSHAATSTPTYFSEWANHSFTSQGNYIISLRAIDDDDASGEFQTTITIDNQGTMMRNLAPIVSIIGSIGKAEENSPACFIALADDSNMTSLSYQWFFGDGDSSIGQISSLGNQAIHVYNYSSIFSVIVAARDNQNTVGIAYTTIEIVNVNPKAVISGNATWIEYQVAVFNGSSSWDTSNDDPSLTYIWDFGDGNMAVGKNVSNVYGSTGLFDVMLTVRDNDGATSISVMRIEVSLSSPPTAILADRMAYGPILSLTFYGIADSNPSDVFKLNYSWNFGDGSPSVVGAEVTHIFSADGAYDVTLTVTDPHGQTAVTNATAHVAIDSDGDSLTDSQEVSIGTNPNNPDTDGDSLTDYWEIYTYKTNSTEADSDSDGANDWYEAIYLGYNVDTDRDTLFNPWDPDSDNDGMLDGVDPHPLLYDAPDGNTYSVIGNATSNDGFIVVVAVNYIESQEQQAATISTIDQSLNQQQHNVKISSGSDPQPVPTITFYYRKGPRLPVGGIGPSFTVDIPAPFSSACIEVRYPLDALGITDAKALDIYQFSDSEGKWMDMPASISWNDYRVTVAMSSLEPCYQLGDSQAIDSDMDGLTDYYEVHHGHGTLPTDPNDPDMDCDGLTDGEEVYGTYSGGVPTVPFFSDSDHDGLFDGWDDSGDHDGIWQFGERKGEVGDNSQGFAGGYGTNPCWSDSDNDNLFDGWQDMNGDQRWEAGEAPGEIGDTSQQNKGGYGSDPLNRDYDGDGVKDGSDVDPLTNLWLTVTVSEINALDMIDWHGSPPYGPIREPADFYWEIDVYSYTGDWQPAESSKPFISDEDHIRPGQSYSFDLDDRYQSTIVKITLCDVDGSSLQLCDIVNDGKIAILAYDHRTGSWSGNDYHGDPNGYGHVSGNEDGSTDVVNIDGESDCELWFTMRMNDYWEDHDHLSCWEEVNVYNSDPLFSDSNGDWDGDGIPNDYEDQHGLNPAYASDALQDLDGDLVPNLWEYELRDRGKSPDNPLDTYGFALSVSFEWDVDNAYRDAFIQTLRDASSYLFAATDGHFLFKYAELQDSKGLWDAQGSIQIHDAVALRTTDGDWPHADAGTNGHVYLPREYDRSASGLPSNTQPGDLWYYKMLAHELCHARFSLRDEYKGYYWAGPIPITYDIGASNLLHSLMADNDYMRLSTRYDYDHPQDGTDTHDTHTLQWLFNGESCWETVFRQYNYFTGLATGQVYGVQFDLDGDYQIDSVYPQGYIQDSSAFWDSSLYAMRYEIGTYLSVTSF